MTNNSKAIQLRRIIKLIFNSSFILAKEFNCYLRYSNINYYRNQDTFLAIIIANYHVIEKGLSMPDFRLGFGYSRVVDLIEDLLKYIDLGFSTSNEQFRHGADVIAEYIDVHLKNNYTLDPKLMKLWTLLSEYVSCCPSTPLEIRGSDYFIDSNASFAAFSNSRHSLRNYSTEEVSVSDLLNAIKLSQNTPTPCNRQPNKTYIVEDKELIKSILELQGGTRGFGHLGNKLLIITSDISKFSSIRELHESYKTGGMYAMNLLYALHYYKIGACSLQWGEQPKKDRKLRKLISIPNNECVIMMLLLGYPPNISFKQAVSPRNHLS